MLKNFTNWFKWSNGKCDEKMSSACEEVVRLMQLIIDDEASEEDEKKFHSHVGQCTSCFNKYEMDKSVLEEIKSKLGSKPCPQEVVNSIRQKIREISHN